jgi:hypothetical protein
MFNHHNHFMQQVISRVVDQHVPPVMHDRRAALQQAGNS